MRIALVLSSLACGGAERVATLLAGELAQRGHAMTLVTLDPRTPDFHAVPPHVERVAVDGPGSSRTIVHALANNVRGVAELARTLGRLRPDVVLSFGDTTNVKTLLATRIGGIPTVVSERVDPRTVDIGRAWSRLRRIAYPRAASVVVQTEGVRAWAEQLNPRVAVIGNPVAASVEPDRARAHEIVAVGRLVPQKGFDVLVRAFATLATPWRLTILGEGPARRELESLIDRLGVRDRVALPGEVHDVRARLRSAAVFVLASRFEGFPNALLEAMAEGTAIVATDCRSGPAEILRDCPSAALVPVDDAPALADALARMLADATLRDRCGTEARAVASRFSPATIASTWEDVLARAR